MTRRILGQLVVRDEADRYLDCVLSWHRSILDAIHVYDDRSTDDTVKLAQHHGCVVSQRELNVPSFVEHEGKFREAAWRQFEAELKPTVEDWVLAFDADEIPVSREDEQGVLHDQCAQAEAEGAVAVTVPIPEIWGVTEAEGADAHREDSDLCGDGIPVCPKEGLIVAQRSLQGLPVGQG